MGNLAEQSASASGGLSLPARFARALQKHWELYLLFLPIVAWYAIFCYAPMGGIVIAFKDFKVLRGIWASDWVGMKNFSRFISSPAFRSTFANTIIISLMNLAFAFPAPIIFALLLNEIRSLIGKRFVQTVSYLPHFISWTIAGSLFYMMLSPSTGIVNYIVRFFGGSPVNFLGEGRYFRWILVISSVWKGLGWGAIVYLAAIAGVDEELYEAATIDGAKRFRRIWSITIPSISNVVVVMLILQVGTILNSNFEQIFIMANATVLSVGETIEYYIYRVGLSSTNNFSLAAAVGLFKSVVGFALILITNAISKRVSDGGGIW
ncbi:MAG: ABC transporter permease subunit [Clostridiales bacterium]|nr:ABC transporter permease subunit [Clostridiales bacterium]